MAQNRKQSLRSMDQIVDFMLDSDDDIDLGEHSSDMSDLDSDWECEVETNPDAGAPDSADMSVESDTRPVQFTNSTIATDAAGNVPAQLDVDASDIASTSHIHAASSLISSEQWSSSSSEEEISAKVLRRDNRVRGTRGVRSPGGGASGVQWRGVCRHGVYRRSGHIRGGFHIDQGLLGMEKALKLDVMKKILMV